MELIGLIKVILLKRSILFFNRFIIFFWDDKSEYKIFRWGATSILAYLKINHLEICALSGNDILKLECIPTG